MNTNVCDCAVSKSITVVSRTVTAPPLVTAKAPLPLPLSIVNPAVVGESPEDVRVTTGSSLAISSAIVGDAAVISITASVTATVNCVVVPLVSALIPEMVTVHEAADS